MIKRAGMFESLHGASLDRKAGKDAKLLNRTFRKMKKRGLVKEDGNITRKLVFSKSEKQEPITKAKETWNNLSTHDKIGIGGAVAAGAGKLYANKLKEEKEEKEKAKNSKKGGAPIIINS